MGTCERHPGSIRAAGDTFSPHIRAAQIIKVLPIMIIGCHAKRQKESGGILGKKAVGSRLASSLLSPSLLLARDYTVSLYLPLPVVQFIVTLRAADPFPDIALSLAHCIVYHARSRYLIICIARCMLSAGFLPRARRSGDGALV